MKDITEEPPHDKRIAEIWAWVVTHENGGEGIPAMTMEIAPGLPTMMPMLGADEERIRSLEPIARQIAAAKGLPIKLMRFSVGEVIAEHQP